MAVSGGCCPCPQLEALNSVQRQSKDPKPCCSHQGIPRDSPLQVTVANPMDPRWTYKTDPVEGGIFPFWYIVNYFLC